MKLKQIISAMEPNEYFRIFQYWPSAILLILQQVFSAIDISSYVDTPTTYFGSQLCL